MDGPELGSHASHRATIEHVKTSTGVEQNIDRVYEGYDTSKLRVRLP